MRRAGAFLLSALALAGCPSGGPTFAGLEDVPGAKKAPPWAASQLVWRHRFGSFVERICEKGFGEPPTGEARLSFDDRTEIPRLFPAYYWLTGDERVFAPMNALADEIDLFPKGYYACADTEHGTEPFYGLLAPLARLDPSNRKNCDRLAQVARYLRNADPAVPAWYDPQTRHLRSMWFGTERVDGSKNRAVDYPYNLRYAWVALAAADVCGDADAFAWAKEYLGEWAADIRANAGVCPSEISIPDHKAGGKGGRWSLLAENPNWCWEGYGFKSVRAIDVFTDMYRRTQDRAWLTPVKSHLQTLLRTGSDDEPAEAFRAGAWTRSSGAPRDNKGYFAGIFLKWRRFSNDSSLDEQMLRLCRKRVAARADEKGISALYAFVAYVLERDPARMEWALASALETVSLSQSKVMELPTRAGEGGFGVYGAMAVLSSAFGGYGIHEGQVPWMEVHYVRPDGKPGLPGGVAAWYRFHREPPDVLIYNGGIERVRVGIRAGSPRIEAGETTWVEVGPGEEKAASPPR